MLSRRGFIGAGAAAAVAPLIPLPELKPAAIALDNSVLWQPQGSSVWFVSWGKETIQLSRLRSV